MKSFRELDVWNKAMELTDKVYDVVRQFPNEERYALGDQLRRAVVSIPSNIAEGFGSQARGSLFEVDTQLEIAVRRGYCAKNPEISGLMNDIVRMLFVLSRKLRATPAHDARSTMHAARFPPPEARCTKHEARI